MLTTHYYYAIYAILKLLLSFKHASLSSFEFYHFNSCIVFYNLEYCLVPNPFLLSSLTQLINTTQSPKLQLLIVSQISLTPVSIQLLNSTLIFLPKYVLNLPPALDQPCLAFIHTLFLFYLDHCQWINSCCFWDCLPLGLGPAHPPATQLPNLQIWPCNFSAWCMVHGGLWNAWHVVLAIIRFIGDSSSWWSE